MAFCSVCGAQTTGPFCGRCGAAAGAAGQAAPQQPPQPQQSPQPQAQAYQAPQYQAAPQGQAYQAQPYQGQPAGMAPAKKSNTLLWVLGIIGGLLILGCVVVGLVFFYVVHKVKQAGFDPELMKNNPGLAVSKMITAFNPDVEVVDHDDRAGTITVRDKKTGKVVTMTFDDVKSGQFKMKIQEDGKTASLNFGENISSKLPSWVPAYPGATTKNGGFSITSSGEDGDGGNFAFTTPDPAERVQSFYEGKAHEMNMQVEATVASGVGTVVELRDPSTRHTIAVTIVSSSPTTVNVTYASK